MKINLLRDKFAVLAAAVCLAMLVLPGCGGEKMSSVKGQVTLDGQPLEKGTITFLPADGQSQSAAGPIVNGAYSVDLQPGPKKIQVTASKVVGQRPAYQGDPKSPMVDVTEEMIPSQYNTKSTLEFVMADGENTHDLALESKTAKK